MAGTLLGVCDLTFFANDTDWSSNKLGGNPDWLNEVLISDVKCETCKGPVVFIGQLYCPVEEADRVFYLFLCSNQTCIKSSKSWTVLRCQSHKENVIKPQSLNKKAEVKSVFEFDSDDEDWDDDAINCTPFQLASTSNKYLKQENDKTRPSTSEEHSMESDFQSLKISFQDSTFKPFYINVFDENELASEDSLNHEQDLLKKYLRQEKLSLDDVMYSLDNGKKSGGKESYQKFKISCMNDHQKKFFQTVSKCPEQIIRYCYKGDPLVYGTVPHSSKISRCSCGSPRTFEFQIMPSISNFIVPNVDMSGLSLEGLDIGTVYIYTCSSNCWFKGRDKMKFELALVEKDDTAKKESTLKKSGRYKL